MFGNGIGTLTISLSDTRESQERDVWSLTGEAGNAWYQAEVPVSSSNPFKVIRRFFTIIEIKNEQFSARV